MQIHNGFGAGTGDLGRVRGRRERRRSHGHLRHRRRGADRGSLPPRVRRARRLEPRALRLQPRLELRRAGPRASRRSTARPRSPPQRPVEGAQVAGDGRWLADVPGFPGERCDARIVADVVAFDARVRAAPDGLLRRRAARQRWRASARPGRRHGRRSTATGRARCALGRSVRLVAVVRGERLSRPRAASASFFTTAIRVTAIRSTPARRTCTCPGSTRPAAPFTRAAVGARADHRRAVRNASLVVVSDAAPRAGEEGAPMIAASQPQRPRRRRRRSPSTPTRSRCPGVRQLAAAHQRARVLDAARRGRRRLASAPGRGPREPLEQPPLVRARDGRARSSRRPRARDRRRRGDHQLRGRPREPGEVMGAVAFDGDVEPCRVSRARLRRAADALAPVDLPRRHLPDQRVGRGAHLGGPSARTLGRRLRVARRAAARRLGRRTTRSRSRSARWPFIEQWTSGDEARRHDTVSGAPRRDAHSAADRGWPSCSGLVALAVLRADRLDAARSSSAAITPTVQLLPDRRTRSARRRSASPRARGHRRSTAVGLRSSSARDRGARRRAHGSARFRRRAPRRSARSIGKDGRRAARRPMGYRIDDFDARSADVYRLDGRARRRHRRLEPTAQWRVLTLELAWTPSGWRVTGRQRRPAVRRRESPLALLAAEVSTFKELRHVP